MVAGGGASVVYADTVADYGMGHELANYGEYSGAPSTQELEFLRPQRVCSWLEALLLWSCNRFGLTLG